jgi:predicted Zn-dependent protease
VLWLVARPVAAPRSRAAALLPLALLAAGCSRNEAFFDRELSVLSESRGIELGKQAEPRFVASYGGETPSPGLQRYVADLGRRLTQASERPGLPWAFHIVDSDGLTSFALPGGKVFVTRGLLHELESEAELAAVLGHEVAHVSADHVGEQVSRELAMQLSTSDTGLIARQQDARWLGALGVSPSGDAVYLLEFSRDQEIQADALAVGYLAGTRENPLAVQQAVALLERLGSGAAPPPAWLATHPYPATRKAAVSALITKDEKSEARSYAFGADRFEAEVLARLGGLPPPRHHPVHEAQPGESSLRAPSAPEDDVTRAGEP